MSQSAFSNLHKQVVAVDGLRDTTHALRALRSHNVVVVRNCRNAKVIVRPNQRAHQILFLDCVGCDVMVLDSAVIASRSLRAVGCQNCRIVIEDADVRKIEMWRCSGCRVVIMGDDILVDECVVVTREGCEGTVVVVADLVVDLGAALIRWTDRRVHVVPDSGEGEGFVTSLRPTTYIHSHAVSSDEGLRVLAELRPYLTVSTFASDILTDILSEVRAMEATPPAITDVDVAAAYDEERVEMRSDPATIQAHASAVALRIRAARYVTVFTGAGVSTSANIPDFRGPKGLWTQRDKTGRSGGGKGLDMPSAVPTYAHYAITELARRGIVRYVVTTNMDGLHVRSGLPRHLIEELHGGCFKEYCPGCRETRLRGREVHGPMDGHKTGSQCDWCGTEMLDTIVHFGDSYRDDAEPVVAGFHARRSDYVIVLGTSMSVQPAVSYPLKSLRNSNGGMCLVNMQATPADDLATERVFAETDVFMRALMAELGLASFDTEYDALQDWTAVDVLLTAQRAARMKNNKK